MPLREAGPSKPRRSAPRKTETWVEWAASFIWTPGPFGPPRPTDAAHDPVIRTHFLSLLDNTEPPQSFKAAEVAQLIHEKDLKRLGYESWQDALPGIRELAFELREFGYCEILQKGKVLGGDITPMDVEGGFRIRRQDAHASELVDDW